MSKFVFISSLSVLIGRPWYDSVSGNEPPQPDTFYACTKNFGEQIRKLYSEKHNTSVTCLRLGMPFPLGDDRESIRLGYDKVRPQLVHFDDIATSIRLALHERLPFTQYPIVSDCDVPWVKPQSTQRLGYVPRYYFTAQGVQERR